MTVSRSLAVGAVCALAVLGSSAPARAGNAHEKTDPPSVSSVSPRPGHDGPTRWQARQVRGAAARASAIRTNRSVPLGTAPQVFAVDSATGTAYVSSDEGIVSVVDIRHCNIRNAGACSGPIAEIAGPVGGIGVALYSQTLYVTSGTDGTDGVVSVYDLTRCHTGDTAGCGAALAAVPIGDGPIGLVADVATGTLYVGNIADHVEVVDLHSCRSGRVSGCAGAVVGAIPARDGPLFPILDGGRRTLYVPANGPYGDASGDTVHVVGLVHCRAGDTTGCAVSSATLPAGSGAVIAYEDRRTGTLYVANQSAGTVSVLDVRRCTGIDPSGCAQTPTDVPLGANPMGGIAQTDDGRLYVANSDSDTVSTFATDHCRAADTTGCPTSPAPTARTGESPFWLVYDSTTGTLFSVDYLGRALGVLDARVCSAGGGGCRTLLPSITGVSQQLADQAVHTWYGADENGNLTLTDTRVCTAQHAERCAAAAIHTSVPNSSFGGLAVDDSTHSLFMARNNPTTFRESIVVLDTRTCNATVHTDCSPVAPPLRVPNYGAGIALDPSSHTLYVITQDRSTLQVVDAVGCNALRQTACSAPVGAVPLDGRVYGIAIDPSTRTVYVSEFGDDFDSDVVYAVDSTHCRAKDVTGCTRTPKQFATSQAPLGMVLDASHHSLYVIANGGGDEHAKVNVIDTTTCSARGTAGCAPAAAVTVGHGAFLGALDPVTDQLFTLDYFHAAISVIDTAQCNASTTSGCGARELDVSDLPARIAVDPVTHTVFVQSVQYDVAHYLDTRLT